jgi:hypothetical protein
MSDDSRATLRLAQRDIVRALVAGGDVPAGWDASRVEAAAHALAHKRARAAAGVWPGVHEAMGEDYFPQFIRYARANPLPPSGALADGRRFVRWGQQHGRAWPDAVLLAAARVDLHWRTCVDGLTRRRFPIVMLRRLPGGARVAAFGPFFGAVFWRARV